MDVEYSDVEILVKEDTFKQIIMKEKKKEKSVLVDDDDEVNRKLINAVIIKLGHNVTLAEDGSIAVKHCEEQAYDIIMMDISMPVLDGFQATQQIRGKNGYRIGETPIIALTVFALDGDRERFIDGGFDDYLSKPIEISEVAEKISELTS
jgi:CheY-like chemotaxis protein